MTTWPSDLKAVTAIQYSGPSTKKSNPASATPDPRPDTRDDARRPPRDWSVETTRPTAAATSRITPRTTAAFQKICGDAQASRPVTTAATTHGSAFRAVPAHRRARSTALPGVAGAV